jgi:hypothetical protein
MSSFFVQLANAYRSMGQTETAKREQSRSGK